MFEPWNDKSVLPPPVNTSLCKISFSIKELKICCNTIVRVLSTQAPLHKESAIFSRFIYKFDKKFRNDIGYRNFKKVNAALRKYLSLALVKDVQNFIDMLPANDEIEPYLPTRQMLEYIMMRLITFSKLMYRIAVCSKQAAIFYLNRIKLGESHWMGLMPYALLSRIWSMVLVLLQHSCNWYNRLHPFLKHLPCKGINFLPKEYKMPNNVEEWIDLKNLNQTGRFEWAQKLHVNVESIIVEDEEGDLSENILKYVNNINKKTEKGDDENDAHEPEIQMILPEREVQTNRYYDQGVAISRETYKKISSQHTLNKLSDANMDVEHAIEKVTDKGVTSDDSSVTKKISSHHTLNKLSDAKMDVEHAIERVTDKGLLIKFIEKEEELRNTSDDSSITRHLSFMQWQALKIALMKLNTAKLERKLKKIWQEKCLDYL